MKAVVKLENGKVAVQEVPVPRLRDASVLVKVKAVGLNPTDFKHIDSDLADPGSRSGCDYVGIVEEVGSKVTKPFKKGDRIAGMVHGGNPTNHEDGTFAEYIVAKGDVQIKVPDNLSDEAAATLGVSVSTVGQGLYKSLGLPLPTEPAKTPYPILIYGGSTATGIFGIQYAKASGLTVVATASPHHFDYLKSLGADAVFDYNSPTCAADIRRYTGNKLKLAWDCAGGPEVCAGALSDSEESDYGTITAVEKEALQKVNPKVRGPHHTLAYDTFGERYIWLGEDRPPKPDEFDFMKKFSELSRELLAQGKIKPVRQIVNQGGKGLEGVVKGLDELRAGRVRGGKLVYTL